MQLTPRLDIQRHNGFRSWFRFTLLLLSVFCQPFFSDLGCFGILFFIITAKQIDVIIILIILGLLGSFAWVDRNLARLRSVGGV